MTRRDLKRLARMTLIGAAVGFVVSMLYIQFGST